MTYKDLIINRYPEIKKQVTLKAFRFGMEPTDLLSAVNERIAVNILNDQFVMQHQNQFWGYIQKIITSCALDLRKRKKDHIELDDCYAKTDCDPELKSSSKMIIASILNDLTTDRQRQIFNEILICGETYRSTAVKLNMNINCVKAAVFRIRNNANRKYRQLYSDAIN